MKITKESKIKKAINNLDFAIEIINKDYLSHQSEPKLDDINASYNFIKQILNDLMDNNFGQLKKQNTK